MRITAKGQVTIPQDVREQAGLMPGTDVEFEFEAVAARLIKVKPGRQRRTRGEKLVERMRGRGDFKMTTDEILDLMPAPRTRVPAKDPGRFQRHRGRALAGQGLERLVRGCFDRRRKYH